MVTFRHTEDIEDWLKPKSYDDFWKDISAFDVHLPHKPYCDGKIISGQVERETLLGGLKYLASTQISSKLSLSRRPMVMPDLSQAS